MASDQRSYWDHGDKELNACPTPFLREAMAAAQAASWRQAAEAELGASSEHDACLGVVRQRLDALAKGGSNVAYGMAIALVAAAC